MMMELRRSGRTTEEDIRKIVGEALCEGVEMTLSDFRYDKDRDETVADAEYLIQRRFLMREGFEKRF